MAVPVGFCCRAEARLGGRELPLGTVVAVTIPLGREEEVAVVEKSTCNISDIQSYAYTYLISGDLSHTYTHTK